MSDTTDTREGTPPKDNLFRADFHSDIELRDAEEGGPVMVGHFARFNEWAEINSIFEGHFLERIAPGAFTKTFAENRARIRSLFQHGKDILGQQVLGPVRELREDDVGAYYEVPLFEGVPALIKEGLRAGQYGSSFRFKVMKDDFVKRPERSESNPDGLPERTITEAKVSEFGPVTFPAYAGATAGIRSLTDEFLFGRLAEDPERLLQLLAGTGAAALARRKPEPPEATTSDPEPSRSTPPKRDYLNPGKETPPWHLGPRKS